MSEMKAYVLQGVGDLVYKTVDIPECPDGWAIVMVRAAGICSSDVPRIFKRGTYNFPTIPGHEFSGVVHSVGNEKDSHWVGKRVGIFPLIPCRKCQQCREKHYEMCEHYDYLGSRRDGGFAEYVAVPIFNLIALPDGLSFVGGAMLEPLSVGFHAVKQAGDAVRGKVAVIGTGTIGMGAACCAKYCGAEDVLVIGRGESKRAFTESFEGIKYSGNWREKKCRGSGLIIEAVGSEETLRTAIELAVPGGHIVLVGNPVSDMKLSQNIYWEILRKQLNLYGSWNSSYDGSAPSDWTEAVEAVSYGGIPVERMITHFFKQQNLMDALRLMIEHREPYCKVMTLWNDV